MGYTIVELVVVMMIVTLLGVAVVHVATQNLTDDATVAACRETIRSDLRRIKSEARSNRRARRVVFDPQNDRYQLFEAVGGVWSALRTETLDCDLVSTSLNGNTLIYTPEGAAYEDATDVVTFNAPVTIDRAILIRGSPSSQTQTTINIYQGVGHVD